MPSSFEFLPGLFRFGQYCSQKAGEAAARAYLAKQSNRPKPAPTAPEVSSECYTGPIEFVKPGNILDNSRFEEYREFMRDNKNMPAVRLWGLNEPWQDSGARPFLSGSKPAEQPPSSKPETNPFEK
jgi:hypothetical protein